MKDKSGELYRIAYQCEENKKSGCIGNCGACPFNVALYTRSINDATLLKTTAMMDNNKWHQRQAAIDTKQMMNGLMFIGLIIFCCVSFYQCTHPKPKVKVVEQAPPTQVQQYAVSNPADEFSYMINMPRGIKRPIMNDNAISIAHHVQQNVRDITEDGLINCQDRAMLFFCIVGDAHKCRVIINENPTTGMNHLFVKFKGVTIEPSTGNPMEFQWGKQYDPKYDKDVTEYWYWHRTALY